MLRTREPFQHLKDQGVQWGIKADSAADERFRQLDGRQMLQFFQLQIFLGAERLHVRPHDFQLRFTHGSD